jgi:hypothetical protein
MRLLVVAPTARVNLVEPPVWRWWPCSSHHAQLMDVRPALSADPGVLPQWMTFRPTGREVTHHANEPHDPDNRHGGGDRRSFGEQADDG